MQVKSVSTIEVAVTGLGIKLVGYRTAPDGSGSVGTWVVGEDVVGGTVEGEIVGGRIVGCSVGVVVVGDCDG